MTTELNPEPNRPDTQGAGIEYWRAPPCQIRIVADQDETWVNLEIPFALIGSHECCDIRVGGGSNTPQVAYFVCCLKQCIEVWPTSAIAFARWGAIGPDVELLVGRSRITAHHPLVSGQDHLPLQHESKCVIKASMTWQGNTKPLTFFRRVTLIGETHPSVLRLHGRGMRPSHFAAVNADQALWIVNISPEEMSARDRVRCLRSEGDETQIGNVTIRFKSATVKTATPPVESPTTGAPRLNSQAHGNGRGTILDPPDPDRAVYRPMTEHANVLPPASSGTTPDETKSGRNTDESTQQDRIPKPEGKEPEEPANRVEHSRNSYADAQAEQLMSVQQVVIASPTPLDNAPVPEAASQSSVTNEGDELASELTDRLVSMEKSKRPAFFYVKVAAMTMMFSVAGLLWIALMTKIIRDWF